ncbi:zinc transporter ZIP13 isoform X2 [Hemitrygon akajei]|uniref:zinc transporter ZIP13 isoform X2 n=1 Tax=Hemitrygon akajei TaxID=2704970 RepID=UPI003BF97357
MVMQKHFSTIVIVFCVCGLFPSLSSADIHRANAKKLTRKAAAAQAANENQWWCPENVFELRSWSELFSGERVDAWICSLIGSVMVGLSGVFPLLVIPIEAGATLKSKDGSQRLKRLLSFAIGGLLGDVFLHLLPEAWAYTCNRNPDGGYSRDQQRKLGFWVIVGLLAFFVLEKIFPDKDEEETDYHKISGYLNLIANGIDNFTHGLAVAGSFLVSRKVGLTTTLAILLHEVPHEVGDFAILLRAGFDRWSAAKMQLTTAFGGVLGACFALCAESPEGAGGSVAWILPFTSGGFLYIALVTVVPDLLQETDVQNSVYQVCSFAVGLQS